MVLKVCPRHSDEKVQDETVVGPSGYQGIRYRNPFFRNENGFFFGKHVSDSRMPQKKPKCGQIISFPQKHERNSLCVNKSGRNVNCKHYLACLHTAALANARDLGCKNCSFRIDDTYKMTIRDFTGLMRLYYDARDPEVSGVSKRKRK
jgi:hypothetical protein